VGEGVCPVSLVELARLQRLQDATRSQEFDTETEGKTQDSKEKKESSAQVMEVAVIFLFCVFHTLCHAMSHYVTRAVTRYVTYHSCWNFFCLCQKV